MTFIQFLEALIGMAFGLLCVGIGAVTGQVIWAVAGVSISIVCAIGIWSVS